jgi:hypothetical protein
MYIDIDIQFSTSHAHLVNWLSDIILMMVVN